LTGGKLLKCLIRDGKLEGEEEGRNGVLFIYCWSGEGRITINNKKGGWEEIYPQTHTQSISHSAFSFSMTFSSSHIFALTVMTSNRGQGV
jgi:hypothetical protein